jgi:hypothetical protein
MSVVIVHYHLRRGGVARVIRSASESLTQAGVAHVILVGEVPNKDNADLPFRIVEGLGYTQEGGSLTPLRLVHAMRQATKEALGKTPVTWHFHNHALGKNPLMAEAVAILAETGERLVLQTHDFAEDGRPFNYKACEHCTLLYPVAPQIRHVFLNSRDRANLVRAGLPDEHAVLLPNAVISPAKLPEAAPQGATPLVLYPVRGIRRKNLGEIFLLAALAGDAARFAVTLGPDNPRWQSVHEDWEAFGNDTKLPVDLNVVGRLPANQRGESSYEAWLARATHVVTTSIAEGFGLGFLEPILLGKPLFGRDLPEITCDFAANGIIPGRLYDRLLVPERWIGMETLRQMLVRRMQDTVEAYGSDMSARTLDAAYQSMRHDGFLDFGNLPEDLQRRAILRILDRGEQDKVLVEIAGDTRSAKNWVLRTLQELEPTATPEQLAPYTLDAYRERLLALYASIEKVDAEPPTHLEKHLVLAQFLHPERFQFLQTA